MNKKQFNIKNKFDYDEDEEFYSDRESKYDKIKERRIQKALKTKDIEALMGEYEDDEYWDEDEYRR